MRLTPLTMSCGSAACPAVYLTDDDDIVVQGVALSPVGTEIALAGDEQLVRLPRQLFLSAARELEAR